MRTLLILTKHAAFASAVQASLADPNYQLIAKEDVWEAESLVARGAIDAVVLDVELTDVLAIRAIEQVRAAAPGAPMVVYTTEKQWEWEEDAYLLGVEHVLTKPVRGKLLTMLLDRSFAAREQQAGA
ncbi:MAG: hypothetical protein QOD99_2683, partial [Chthoniobacter sp.]|nr:hypothetical protein [Chthoniobacter sp.]